MPRYQIFVEYVGSNYEGWQIQNKGQTIQGVIQAKISKFLKERINIVGSGRTDSGVHAISQSAHFDTKVSVKDKGKFLKSINFFLKNTNIIKLQLLILMSTMEMEPKIYFMIIKKFYIFQLINIHFIPAQDQS